MDAVNILAKNEQTVHGMTGTVCFYPEDFVFFFDKSGDM